MTKTYIPRLKEKYLKEIVPSLKKDLGLKNDMATVFDNGKIPITGLLF